MFYHQSLATHGLHPRFMSQQQLANLGYFSREVIIEPVRQQPGGGGWVPVTSEPSAYRVTVKVKIADKEYEQNQIVDLRQAKVWASVSGITTFTEDKVMVSVNGIQVTK